MFLGCPSVPSYVNVLFMAQCYITNCADCTKPHSGQTGKRQISEFLAFIFDVAPHELFVDPELQAPCVKLFMETQRLWSLEEHRREAIIPVLYLVFFVLLLCAFYFDCVYRY